MPYPLTDLTGQVFGRLTVLELLPQVPYKDRRYRCQCECGKTHEPTGNNLRNGRVKSCGCLQRDQSHHLGQYTQSDVPTWMVGRRYHRWTVLRIVGYRLVRASRRNKTLRCRKYVALCRCECGTERELGAHTVAQGGSRSCGCLRWRRPVKRKASTRRLYRMADPAPKPEASPLPKPAMDGSAFRKRWDMLFHSGLEV